MNLSLVPVIGIPYPFLSYGGSHIISSIILIYLSSINMDDYREYNHNKMIDNHHKDHYSHNKVE